MELIKCIECGKEYPETMYTVARINDAYSVIGEKRKICRTCYKRIHQKERKTRA